MDNTENIRSYMLTPGYVDFCEEIIYLYKLKCEIQKKLENKEYEDADYYNYLVNSLYRIEKLRDEAHKKVTESYMKYWQNCGDG